MILIVAYGSIMNWNIENLSFLYIFRSRKLITLPAPVSMVNFMESWEIITLVLKNFKIILWPSSKAKNICVSISERYIFRKLKLWHNDVFPITHENFSHKGSNRISRLETIIKLTECSIEFTELLSKIGVKSHKFLFGGMRNRVGRSPWFCTLLGIF